MFAHDQYELLDFGRGRRLERFGELVVDRPCPAAEATPQCRADAWLKADLRFVQASGSGDNDTETNTSRGQWVEARELPQRWTIAREGLVFELKRTPFGHVGLFPEQAENWDWIAQKVAAFRTPSAPPRVLNLFAYTGGSTLAAASAGAEVTHVDSARNVVAWARGNAERSGLAHAPIRWIAEDATKFVARELRRGRSYDAVILDPPSYGHGTRGEPWRLAHDLPELLRMCGQLIAGQMTGGQLTADKLTDSNGRFMLLTCHTPEFTADRLRDLILETFVAKRGGPARGDCVTANSLALRTEDGRALSSGVFARWQA